MKKVFISFWLGLALLFAYVQDARADIDQHCLSVCIHNGGTGTTCLPACSYDDASLLRGRKISPTGDVNKFSVFSAPAPTSELMLPANTKGLIKLPAPREDYSCVAICQKTKTQAELCDQQCLKPYCPAAAVNCTSNMPPHPTFLDTSETLSMRRTHFSK